jgi:hypothetical protein
MPGQMFKYLFLKSLNDLAQFIFQIFSPLFYCEGCSNKASYSGLVWYIGFFYYAECVVELNSAWLEVFATLDCLVLITKRFKFVNSKKFFYISSIILHVYSVVYYLFWFFSLKIENVVDSAYFIVETTQFHQTNDAKILRYIHTVQRDFCIFAILFLLNLAIFIQFKANTLRKKKLFNMKNSIPPNGNPLKESDLSNNSKRKKFTLSSAKKAERNNRNMIFLIAVNYFVGHFFTLLYYIPFPASPQFWSCFFDFVLIPFYLSYIINNIFYIIYNKHFYRYTKANIQFLFRPFRNK